MRRLSLAITKGANISWIWVGDSLKKRLASPTKRTLHWWHARICQVSNGEKVLSFRRNQQDGAMAKFSVGIKHPKPPNKLRLMHGSDLVARSPGSNGKRRRAEWRMFSPQISLKMLGMLSSFNSSSLFQGVCQIKSTLGARLGASIDLVFKRFESWKLKIFNRAIIRALQAAAGGIAAKKSGVGGAAAGCMYWDTCKALVQKAWWPPPHCEREIAFTHHDSTCNWIKTNSCIRLTFCTRVVHAADTADESLLWICHDGSHECWPEKFIQILRWVTA